MIHYDVLIEYKMYQVIDIRAVIRERTKWSPLHQ